MYTGGNAIAYAVDSLATARDGGMHLAYVTNNALRTPDAVAAHLTELGIPTEASDVITSAQAVARLIAEQVPAGARVLVVGGEGLRVALRERGLVPVESAEDEPVAVVQGYGGPELPWGRFAEAVLRHRARCALVRVQHRPDDPRCAGDRAGERGRGGGGADRDRCRAAGGGQTVAADASRDDPADRGRAAAGGGGTGCRTTSRGRSTGVSTRCWC
ncbi:hypothetical protein SGLAM104S_07127 [Streptomyces glaucescens]